MQMQTGESCSSTFHSRDRRVLLPPPVDHDQQPRCLGVGLAARVLPLGQD